MNSKLPNIVVSLTSYPPRIGTVGQVVLTLLAQTVKPWKIVLWLAREEFPDGEASLPTSLVALTKGTVFEIDWCENYRSHKKLIPALRKYPDCAIVTVDDDLLYPPDMLERLVAAYRSSPTEIHSMWVRIITAKKGVVQTFLDWNPTWISSQGSAQPSFDNYILGGSGTLYPPGCLDNRVFDSTLMNDLCPNQDDFWFWAMAVLNGTKIHGVSCVGYEPKLLEITQDHALWRDNCINGGNDATVTRLFDRFPELKDRLSLSHPPLPKNARHFGGLIRSMREGSRTFSTRLNIPLFQMKYNEDFSQITYYILKVPVFRVHCDSKRHE